MEHLYKLLVMIQNELLKYNFGSSESKRKNTCKRKLRDMDTLYYCREFSVRRVFVSWGQTGKMQSRHHFSLLIPLCAQTLCRMYECEMFHILSTVAVLFSPFNTKECIKIIKYYIIAFTFWMSSLIPGRLQGESHIISGTTDALTASFTLSEFSETAGARSFRRSIYLSLFKWSRGT